MYDTYASINGIIFIPEKLEKVRIKLYRRIMLSVEVAKKKQKIKNIERGSKAQRDRELSDRVGQSEVLEMKI